MLSFCPERKVFSGAVAGAFKDRSVRHIFGNFAIVTLEPFLQGFTASRLSKNSDRKRTGCEDIGIPSEGRPL
jgi:hypothetical protein